MPQVDVNSLGTMLGLVAAALVTGTALIYRAWARLKLDKQVDSTATTTLKMLDEAVEHWKALHDEAWAQVRKERELREAAELRASTHAGEIERLRTEVARLSRDLDQLRSMVTPSNL